MKRILKITLLVSFLVLTFSLVSSAAAAEPITGTAGENITWTIDAKGVLTFTGTGDMPDYNWYENRSPWYVHRLSVKSVVISEGITSIGACSFKDATAITKITLPATIKSIGKEAFYSCTSLRSFTCPAELETIGSGAFINCRSMTAVKFSETLKIIEDNAFNGCESLRNVTFPEGLLEIKEKAFFGCKAMTRITLPSTVKTVSKSAFANCSGVTGIAFAVGTRNIEEEAFANCSKVTRITFSDTIEKIGKYAFKNCVGVETLVFPAGLMSIGSGAFADCNKLTKVTYKGTKEDWSDVLLGINNTPLTTVKINCTGKAAPRIVLQGECGENAKYVLTSKRVLTISGTGDMENYGLNGPNSPWYIYRVEIRTIIVEEGITGIGDFAFRDCNGITSVTLPQSLKKIGKYAFNNCRDLVGLELPSGVETIEKYAFGDCTKLESLKLPEKLQTIGENAFYKCRALTEIEIPDSVKSVGADAFIYCTNLSKITLGKGMSTVNSGVFRGTAATELRIPANIKRFSEGAFKGCTNQMTVYTLYDEENFKDIRIDGENEVLVNAIVNYKKPIEDITILLDGNAIDCEKYGQRATIVEGRTLVPLRAIFEALEATVEWDGQTRTVTSTLGETTIKLTIGDTNLYKGETPVTLDVPAMLINDRTMVPARAVSEAYGVAVDWDEYTRTVILTKPITEETAK